MSIALNIFFGISIVIFFVLTAKLLYLVINKKVYQLNPATKAKLIVQSLAQLLCIGIFGYFAKIEPDLLSNIAQIFMFLLLLVVFGLFAKKHKTQKSKQD